MPNLVDLATMTGA